MYSPLIVTILQCFPSGVMYIILQSGNAILSLPSYISTFITCIRSRITCILFFKRYSSIGLDQYLNAYFSITSSIYSSWFVVNIIILSGFFCFVILAAHTPFLSCSLSSISKKITSYCFLHCTKSRALVN